MMTFAWRSLLNFAGAVILAALLGAGLWLYDLSLKDATFASGWMVAGGVVLALALASGFYYLSYRSNLAEQAVAELGTTGRFDYLAQAISDPDIDAFFRDSKHVDRTSL